MFYSKVALASFCLLIVKLPVSAEADPIQVLAGEQRAIAVDTLFTLTQVWVLDTNFGIIPIEMAPQSAPVTVENFRWYAEEGYYNNSIIHRSVPGFVVQGGGFFIDINEGGPSLATVPTADPITNEPGISNLRGTVAMAKLGGDPDSATSQWFINLGDNSENLDNQNGGFTVFGQVIGEGMTVVDAIAALPVYNATQDLGGAFGDLPLSEPNLNISSFVLVESVTEAAPEFSFAFLEGDSDEIEVSIVEGEIVFEASATASGSYQVEVVVSYLDIPLGESVLFDLTIATLWYDGADVLNDGWRYFDWFKGFRPGPDNWIFHGRHGWLFVQAESTEGMFLWDVETGRWLWSNETVYPWMYAYGPDEGWVFFEGGHPGSR